MRKPTLIPWSPVAAEADVWELFHENAKLGRHDPHFAWADWRATGPAASEPRPFAQYRAVVLPPRSPLPGDGGDVSLHTGHLGALLAEAHEPLASPGGPPARPGPFHLFLHCIHLEGLDAGLYYYDPPSHLLRLLSPGGHSGAIAAAMPDGQAVRESEVVAFITAELEWLAFPDASRAYRSLLLEAGARAQALQMAAARLGLACVPVADYFDREIDAWLGLDGVSQSTLLLRAIGRPRGPDAKGNADE